MPRRRSWRWTITSRRRANSSVDVVAERLGLKDDHAAAPGGDQAGTLQLRKGARRRLARGSGELGDLGLGGLDDHVPPWYPVRAASGDLAEQRARHAPRDRLERLARDPLVRLAQPVSQALEHL